MTTDVASEQSVRENRGIGGVGVEIEKVTRTFGGDARVIDDLSLAIRPGEFVSLLGPSGCGKSTLLRMIAGLDKPDDGSVRCDVGTDAGRFDQTRFYRAFVFQDPQLLPWRTVLRNVTLPLELMRRPRAEYEERAHRALELVGLADALEKVPAELSGGMKMRVSVARALVSNPRLLLLDEPFAALDENTRFRLQEDLRRLWLASGITVVFVTHSVSEAVFLSDRAIVLSDRPAAVMLDHRIGLARDRTARTRLEPVFVAECGVLTQAFMRGELRS